MQPSKQTSMEFGVYRNQVSYERLHNSVDAVIAADDSDEDEDIEAEFSSKSACLSRGRKRKELPPPPPPRRVVQQASIELGSSSDEDIVVEPIVIPKRKAPAVRLPPRPPAAVPYGFASTVSRAYPDLEVVTSPAAAAKLTLHIRCARGNFKCNMENGQHFQFLYDACAKHFKVPSSRVCLRFDSMLLKGDQTPAKRHVMEGDVIACEILGVDPDGADGGVAEEEDEEEEAQGEDALRLVVRVTDKDKFVVKFPASAPFSKLAAKVAKMRRVAASGMKFEFDGALLPPNGTPEGLDMEDDDIIECKINTASSFDYEGEDEEEEEEDDDETLSLVVRFSERQKETFKMKSTSKMKTLIDKVAAKHRKAARAVTLIVDGQTVNPNSTPDDLDLESGEILDCRLK